MKRALSAQTLRAGGSKAEQKKSPAADPLLGSAGRPKFNQLETVDYLYLQTLFGEDRRTQFRVMVTDPQTNKHSHKPTDRSDYNTLRRS